MFFSPFTEILNEASGLMDEKDHLQQLFTFSAHFRRINSEK